MGTFLQKNQSSKASKSQNVVLLLSEVSELRRRPMSGEQQIIPCCQTAGVTVAWLKN